MLSADRPSRKKQKLLRDVREEPPTKRLNCDVDPEFYRRIRRQALEEDRSISSITRRLWKEYLDRQK